MKVIFEFNLNEKSHFHPKFIEIVFHFRIISIGGERGARADLRYVQGRKWNKSRHMPQDRPASNR